MQSEVGPPRDGYWMRSLTRNFLVRSTKVVQGCVPQRKFLKFRGKFQDVGRKHTELFFWEKPTPLTGTDRLRLDRFRSIVAEAQELVSSTEAFGSSSPLRRSAIECIEGLANFEPSTPEMQEWPLNHLPDEMGPILTGDFSGY